MEKEAKLARRESGGKALRWRILSSVCRSFWATFTGKVGATFNRLAEMLLPVWLVAR